MTSQVSDFEPVVRLVALAVSGLFVVEGITRAETSAARIITLAFFVMFFVLLSSTPNKKVANRKVKR